jgi:hypothetical protein
MGTARFLIAAAAVLLVVVACDHDGEYSPINTTYLFEPHLAGPWVSQANGVLTAKWDDWRILLNLYRRPGDLTGSPPRPPTSVIQVALAEEGPLWVWLVKVETGIGWKKQKGPEGGAKVFIPGGAPTLTVIDGDTVGPGIFDFELNLNDQYGNPLPSGVYRLYMNFSNLYFVTHDLIYSLWPENDRWFAIYQ